jgi:hypothetical protein
MELLKELLNILTEVRSDWSILPATMALYNRRTVDIITAASEWKDHDTTILVCKKGERTCFVSSSSDSYDYYAKDIGKSFTTMHDQSMVSKGTYKLVNVVVLKGGKILKQANDIGINEKASLSVFK